MLNERMLTHCTAHRTLCFATFCGLYKVPAVIKVTVFRLLLDLEVIEANKSASSRFPLSVQSTGKFCSISTRKFPEFTPELPGFLEGAFHYAKLTGQRSVTLGARGFSCAVSATISARKTSGTQERDQW